MFKIGALSDQGWVSDPASTLNYLFTCYLLTDAAQTLLFDRSVISLAHSYHLHINDPDKMAVQVRNDLTTLINRYFPQCDVQIRARQIEGSHYGILMYAKAITEDNQAIELTRVMEISTANLRKVIQVNNFGDGQNVLGSLCI